MLRAALLSHALPNYLLLINKVAVSVIILFTSFGLLFYLLIISAPTLSYSCHCEFRSPSPLAS